MCEVDEMEVEEVEKEEEGKEELTMKRERR